MPTIPTSAFPVTVVLYVPTNYFLKVSTDMKKLNAKFARLHGYSSLANLIAFLGLVFHGLWIGSYGIGA